MKITTDYLFILMLIVFSLFSINANASTNSVYSIAMGKPLITSDGFKVQTITRGFAANDPVYRVMVQTVAKTIAISVLRKTVGVTPMGIAFLLATDYFLSEDTGEIVTKGVYDSEFWSKQSSSDIGSCVYKTSNQGYMTIQACYSLLTGVGADFAGVFDRYVNETAYWVHPSNYVFPELSDSLVSDVDLFASMENYFETNENSTDLFLNANGTVNQDYFPNPEFELYTAEDSELMALYGSGLLQSTDPLLDNYLAPDELARIKEMYDSAHKTDEQIAEELTADVDKPMTKAQYAEEQSLKEDRADASADNMKSVNLDGLDKTTEMDEQFKQIDTVLTNIGTTGLPSLLPAVPSFPSGSCQSMVFFGSGVVFPSQSQCAKLTEFKDLLGWALYVIFFFMIVFETLKEANK